MHDSLPSVVPIFPLPEVVLFPQQLLPLHIFEPRYRAMTADALADHGCIAIALLRPGYEEAYFTPHAMIHPVVGVGRIVTAERLPDGRYNLLLRGEARARVSAEETIHGYRLGDIEVIRPRPSAPNGALCDLRGRLKAAVQSVSACRMPCRDAFLALFDQNLCFGPLVDLIAGASPIAAELRQTLLEELDERRRGEHLLETLCVVNAVQDTDRAAARPEHVSMN
ncbi:MAG: LON peptidase substrate-binding domain-containing protein [Planctomycetes bacterium]|nr:LON peptidase substrate-binding domain-containing protein [Planctomycetota bacterium]